jgi:FkbM family methyltransferase
MTYHVEKTCQVSGMADIYVKLFGDKTQGTFVEVGAYDGITYSNTYGLALAGWRGLLFEPHPELYGKCIATYRNMPQVRVENISIGEWDGVATLYLGDYLTTTDKDMVAVYDGLNWSKGMFSGQVGVSMCTLDMALERNAWPVGFDVLVVDTEGTELAVLCGFDLAKWRPRMAIIEACEQHSDIILAKKAPEINRIFLEAGYDKTYCDSVNSIFVRRES